MARGLTKKQLGFIKDYVKTGNGTQSALKNYDTTDYKTAGVIAVENIAKPNVKNAIEEIYRRNGLTTELITTSLVEDIEKKPQNRLGEMRLGAEILRMTEKEDLNRTLIINITGESAKRYAHPAQRAKENSA